MKTKLLVMLGCMLMALEMLGENTKTISVAFSEFPKGTQYAENEKHDLGDGLVIYTTNCYFTNELRIYSEPNGYIVSDPLPGAITKIELKAGYVDTKGKLSIYGSIAGDSWDLIKTIETTKKYTSASNYSIAFLESSTYNRFKISLESYSQQRIISMTVTYVNSGEVEGGDNPNPPAPDDEPEQPSDPTEPNDGSKSKPYTVAEVKAKSELSYKTESDVWVKGRIYGTISGNATNVNTSNFTHSENIVIGDATVYIPIRLTESDVRDLINLKDYPYLLGKEILIYGDLTHYYSVPGMVSPTKYEITYDVSINRYGYASLFLDMPASVPAGATAYYCTTEGDRANLLPVGDIIPAGVGVIIEGQPNTTCTLTYTTEANADEASICSNNRLIGFTQDTEVADGNAYYALNVKEDKVGFYIPRTAVDATDATKGFNAKAYKAYLQVPADQQTTMFIIHRENGETGIVPVTHTSDGILYDLQGRIAVSPAPGLYILNGKKVLINSK